MNDNRIEPALNRRGFLAAAIAAPAIFTSKARAQANSGSPLAKTAYGPVRGAIKDSVNVFKGIPLFEKKQ